MEPLAVPPVQTAAPAAPANPPSVGGGLGSPATGASVPASGSQPTPPQPVAPAQTLEQMTAAALGTQPAAPASTPAAVAPATPVAPVQTVESLQAELAAIRSKQLSDQELEAMRQFAAYGRQAWEQRHLQQQPAAPAAPVAPAAQPSLTGVVPFSEQDRQMLVPDANAPLGYTAMPGAPADLLVRYRAHVESTRKYFQDLATDPRKVLAPIIAEEAKRIAAELYQQNTTQASNQQAANQIAQQNREWVLQKDPTSPDGFKRDWQGNLQPTEAGNLYLGFVEELARSGLSDVTRQDALARQMVIGHYAQLRQQQPAQQPAPQPASLIPPQPAQPQLTQQQQLAQQNEAAKQALLNRAATVQATAPMSSMVPPPIANTNMPKQSLMDMFKTNAAQMGVTL